MNGKNAVGVKELAEMLGLEEQTAYGFLRALADLGMVQIVKRPQPEGKKGKPMNLYVFSEETGPMLGRLVLSKFMEHINKTAEEPAAVVKAAEQLLGISAEKTNEDEDEPAPTCATLDAKKTEAA